MKCEACVYGVKEEYDIPNFPPSVRIQCHRYPPQRDHPRLKGEFEAKFVYPMMYLDDWCGEFKAAV